MYNERPDVHHCFMENQFYFIQSPGLNNLLIKKNVIIDMS